MPTETTERGLGDPVAHVGAGDPAPPGGVPLAHRPDRRREPVGVEELGGVDVEAGAGQGADDDGDEADEDGGRARRAAGR